MAKQDVAEVILAALEKEAPAHGIEIVDVDVVGATKAPCVRVRMDWLDEDRQPIGLDELCGENVWVEAIVDEIDPFSNSYTLEISSPGMDRPLRKASDFERFAGERVAVVTKAVQGRRKFNGELQGMDGTCVVVACDGETVKIELDDIKKAHIVPTYEF